MPWSFLIWTTIIWILLALTISTGTIGYMNAHPAAAVRGVAVAEEPRQERTTPPPAGARPEPDRPPVLEEPPDPPPPPRPRPRPETRAASRSEAPTTNVGTNILNLTPPGADAFNDGESHPVGLAFDTLEAAQRFYSSPFGSPVTSLRQQQAWAALQTAIWRESYVVQGYGICGGTVVIPPGRYHLDRPIYVADPAVLGKPGAATQGLCGLTITGAGAATRLEWRGKLPADDPAGCIFFLRDAQKCILKNFVLLPFTRVPSAIRLTKGNATVYVVTGCLFENLDIGNWDARSYFQHCISIDDLDSDGKRRPGADNNNENHQFRRVSVGSYAESGFRIHGSQVHTLKFDDCWIDSDNRGKYGVLCEYGSYFYCSHCSGGHHTVADFGLMDFQSVVDIHGWDSEGSARLLFTGGPTGGCQQTTVRSCRWYGVPPAVANGLGQREPAGTVVLLMGRGPYTFTENVFGGISKDAAGKTISPLLCVHVAVPDVLVHFDRNVFDAGDYERSALVEVNAGRCRRTGTGNYYLGTLGGGRFQLLAP